MMVLSPKDFVTWSSSTVFRPRRLERVAIWTAPSVSGPVWAFSSSYRVMRSLFLVRRAWAPRMIHWYSTRRMDRRFRSAACSISSCWVLSSRYLE